MKNRIKYSYRHRAQGGMAYTVPADTIEGADRELAKLRAMIAVGTIETFLDTPVLVEVALNARGWIGFVFGEVKR